jgi:hypothetical protein
MADPVTLAAIGAVAGAATNKKDPVKGALLGATLGFGGGTVAPALMGGTAAGAGAAGTGAAAGGTFIPGMALETQLAAAPASPLAGFMSKATTPQSLMAGAQLAGAMQPKAPVAQAMPLRPGQQVPITLDQIRAIDAGMFDTIPMDRRMMTMQSRFGLPPVPFLQDLEPIESRRLSLL